MQDFLRRFSVSASVPMRRSVRRLLAMSAAPLVIAACGGEPATAESAEQSGGEQEMLGALAPGAEGQLTDILNEAGQRQVPVLMALQGAHRSEANRARDAFRHPAETLAFFGFDPSMRVVEVWPGGGWYSEVLAPAISEEGALIAAGYDPAAEGFRGRIETAYRAKLAENPEVYGGIEHARLDQEDLMTSVPDGSVDMVLVFRAVHNMVRGEGEVANYFTAMARVLRPGGVLGIVQHRMPEDAGPPNDGTAGYLTEALVIELAEAAGLVLDERSEINANAQDTHVHPHNVWSMPPTLEGEDEALRGLGESDRMTLRFRKPE